MPDGKSLVYALTDSEFESNTLWKQRFDAEKPEKITDLGNDLISESGGLSISPDGKSFMVIQGNWLHDAVLLKGLR